MGGTASNDAKNIGWSTDEPEAKEDFRKFSVRCLVSQEYLDMFEDFTKYPETCAEMRHLYEKDVGYFVRQNLSGSDVEFASHKTVAFDEAIKSKCDFVYYVPNSYARKVIDIYQREQEKVLLAQELIRDAVQLNYLNDHV